MYAILIFMDTNTFIQMQYCVRGAAGFWFSLLSDGSVDALTLHGGCPVIAGSKWITNKWLR